MSSSGGDAGAGRTQGDAGRAVGDPSLEFASWLPANGSYADFDGRLVELPPRTAGRAVTHVERGGEAVLIHDRAFDEDPDLVAGVGTAAALALGNERLQVELRA